MVDSFEIMNVDWIVTNKSQKFTREIQTIGGCWFQSVWHYREFFPIFRNNRCLKIVTDAQQVNLSKCDEIVREYKKFARGNSANPDFLSFIVGESHLDELLCDSMANATEWTDLWHLTRKLLLLSHGQASVERKFSINMEISVENKLWLNKLSIDCPESDHRPSHQCWRGHQSIIK